MRKAISLLVFSAISAASAFRCCLFVLGQKTKRRGRRGRGDYEEAISLLVFSAISAPLRLDVMGRELVIGKVRRACLGKRGLRQ